MFNIFRSEWWPGIKPVLGERKMCSDCKFHSAAVAGWQWDRCKHPDADYGSVIRNDQRPTCADVRKSLEQCGFKAVWFEPQKDK